jgi:O-antigen/teichoic acid export membrane protein
MSNYGVSTLVPVSLKRNVSYMLMGNLMYALSQWGIIMVLAKLGSPTMVGLYTLGLAVTAPIILIFDLQLRSVLATDTLNEYYFHDYFALKGMGSFISLMVLGMVIFIGGYKGEIAFIILLIGLTKLIESIIDLHYGLFQKMEKMEIIAKSLVTRGLASLFIIVILITITSSLLMAVIGYMITWVVLLIAVDVPKAKQLGATYSSAINLKVIKKLFITSFPLGLVMMMISLNGNFPRYVIEEVVGIEAVGYFSAIFYIIVAGNLVINAIAQAISPRLSLYYSQQDYAKFTYLLTKFILIGFLYGFVCLILSIIFGKLFLGILYTHEYVQYYKLFILLVIAGAIAYGGAFLGIALTAMRKFTIQPILSIFWVLSTVVLSIWIIPKHGLIGAGVVAIVTAVVQLFTQAITVISYLVKVKKSINSEPRVISKNKF